MSAAIRTFDTGATRDQDETKLDFEGFLSPKVLRVYAEYMNANRVQSDGSLRDSDNWQKGIPLEAYMKSGWRHFFAWWELHRGCLADLRDCEGDVDLVWSAADIENMKSDLCGLLFNTMGYLHELVSATEES